MSRVAYVNGRFVPHGEAAVHIEDRGYQFADGVYEVWAVLGGALGDAAGHFERLERSLGELQHRRADEPRGAEGGAEGDGAPQPGARGPGLPADHPRRRPARPRLPEPAVAAQRRRHRPRRRPRRRRGAGRARRGGDHRAGDPLGALRHQDRRRCCPTCWPSSRRARPARWRPGSSTTWASSPRARRATPGSSTSRRRAPHPRHPGQHPARHHPRARCSRSWRARG